MLRLRQEKKHNSENHIHREKLDAFDPVRLTVFADLKQDVDRGHNRQNFRHREFQVHRPPEKIGQKNQHGRDEKRDLQAGANRNANRQVHLVFHRHENSGRVLGRVTHNRYHDHTDKHLSQADGVPDVFDRADEKFGEQGDHGSCEEQDGNGLAGRPLPACFFDIFFAGSEQMLVGPQRETEHAEIGKEQDNGDGQRELLFYLWSPAARTGMRSEMKDRRNDQADRGQRERNDGSARCAAAKTLFLVFSAAE